MTGIAGVGAALVSLIPMKSMTLRIPDDVHAALVDEAWRQRISLAALLRQLVDRRYEPAPDLKLTPRQKPTLPAYMDKDYPHLPPEPAHQR